MNVISKGSQMTEDMDMCHVVTGISIDDEQVVGVIPSNFSVTRT